MPLYEYQCEKCGGVFELIQRFSDAPLTVHEGCGGKVEKLLSVSGLHFKGSGFYITDYARGGAKSEGQSEGKSDPKAEGKSEGKSDGKPESKTDNSGAKSDSKPSPESKSESKPAPATKAD